MVKRGKSPFIKINNEDIILSKQGLSNIVAILLLILLVIVVAGIIWVVVKNVIQESSESVELGRFTLDLQIERAQIEDGDVTVVVVRRNPGKGDFIGMNFIFYDGENTEIIKEYTILKETEVRSFTFTLTQISTSNLKKISVSPIFRLSSGKESVGDVTSSMEIKEGMWVGTGESEQTPFELLGFKGMGTAEYSISSSDGLLPEFKRAIVDPLDVLPGHTQTFTVHVYSPYGVTYVTSITQLDNSMLYLDFEKIDEYESAGEIIEVYFAEWIVNDTHVTEYRTNVTATDSEENSNFVVLTWTDGPCQTEIINQGGHGADRTISTDCTTGASSIGGLDGGNLTIAQGVTMTIDSNSVWAFNNGTSITPTGTIIMGGGSIAKGYLFYYDADGDGYAPNTTVLFSTSSSLSGKTRAKDMTAIPTTSAYTIDCCDTEVNAHPYQEEYFTTARTGCGGYNYSCNPWSGIDPAKKWTTAGNCPSCYWEIEGICGQNYYGNVGWKDGSVPACGVYKDYIVMVKMECGERSGNFDLCLDDNCPGSDIENRTQACR